MTVVKSVSSLVAEMKNYILFNGMKQNKTKQNPQKSATSVFLFNGQNNTCFYTEVLISQHKEALVSKKLVLFYYSKIYLFFKTSLIIYCTHNCCRKIYSKLIFYHKQGKQYLNTNV